MDTAKPLTADQLNNMAKSSGYQGSAFTSVGLPSAPATGPGSLGYKPSEDPANSPGGIQSGSSVSNQSKPGFDVFGNPTAQTPTPTATTGTSTTNQSSIDANKQVLQQAQADYQTASKTAMDTITNIQNGTTPLSAGEQAQVDGLKQQFQVFIDQHVLTNTGASGTANIRGYQQGAAEYDPTFQAKTIGSIVTAGQNKVADLNIKMASSVATLTQGFKDNNIKAIQNAWSMYQDASTKRTEALQKTIDSTQKAIKEANDAKIAADKVIYDKEEKEQKDMYDQVIKPIQDAAKEALKNGAPKDVLAKINSALSVEEAVAASVGFANDPTSLSGQYSSYVSKQKLTGKQPMSAGDFIAAQEYKKMYAAESIKASFAKVDPSGLDKEQRNRIYALIDDYRKESKDIKTVLASSDQIEVLGKNSLSSNTESGTRAASQIGLIFSFMRMLDPTSTVREGEYATAQNTAGVTDRVRNSYNKVVDGSFLSDTQINGYVKTGKDIAQDKRRKLETMNSEYDRQAALSGIPKGTITGSSTDSLKTEEQIVKTADDSIASFGGISPQNDTVVENLFKAFPKASSVEIYQKMKDKGYIK